MLKGNGWDVDSHLTGAFAFLLLLLICGTFHTPQASWQLDVGLLLEEPECSQQLTVHWCGNMDTRHSNHYSQFYPGAETMQAHQ